MKKKLALFYVLLTSLCLAALCLMSFHALGFRVNRSDSLPGHVYQIIPLRKDETVEIGACVLIDLSQISNPVIEQGIRRGYVTRKENQPMLKRIGAVPGDAVVLRGGFLFVNDTAAKIMVASQDSHGGTLRPYPTPLVLSEDFYWLSSNPERGFDSRYFGPIHREIFTHRAEPVF